MESAAIAQRCDDFLASLARVLRLELDGDLIRRAAVEDAPKV